MSASVLRVQDLTIEIRRGHTVTRPVRGVSLTVAAGQTVGVVGETGCGKTLTGLSVLRLLPAGATAAGTVEVDGRDVLGLGTRELRDLRGGRVAMVFQNPGTAFDPVTTIGAQFRRVIRTHRGLGRAAALALAEQLLREVELAEPPRVLAAHPHELSGGMLQRAMIALALACAPRLIIADEATSALDVTVARQIRRLLLRLQAEHGFGLLFITHNLAEAYDMCDRITVLYAGQVVEAGPTAAVLCAPAHPYTRGLLAALPGGPRPIAAIEGTVPRDVLAVRGCVYANRCPLAADVCATTVPPLSSVAPDRTAACHFAEALPAATPWRPAASEEATR